MCCMHVACVLQMGSDTTLTDAYPVTAYMVIAYIVMPCIVQMDSDSALTDAGVASEIKRAELMVHIRRARVRA